MRRQTFLSAGLLSGAMVGAGVFSLPYAFSQLGLARGVLWLTFFAWVMIVFHLMYADILLRTPGKHNFVSLAKIYLGDLGEWVGFILTVIQMVLIMVIYLILFLRFVGLIISFSNPLVELAAVLLFWLGGSLAIYAGLRQLALVEAVTSGAIAVVVALIFLYGLPNIDVAAGLQPVVGGLGLVVGPLLFALSGRAAVVELINYARKQDVKKVIVGTVITVAIFYFLFVLGVLALTGGVVSDDTVSGLVGKLPLGSIVFISLMGLLALWHAYIIIGFDINNILTVDFRWPRWLGLVVVVILPIFIYLSGWRDFFGLVSLVGGSFLAAEGIFVGTMWLKLKRHGPKTILLKGVPAWWIYLPIIVFVLVFVNQLTIQFLK